MVWSTYLSIFSSMLFLTVELPTISKALLRTRTSIPRARIMDGDQNTKLELAKYLSLNLKLISISAKNVRMKIKIEKEMIVISRRRVRVNPGRNKQLCLYLKVIFAWVFLTLISLTLGCFLTFHFFLPSLFLQLVFSLHLGFERFSFILMTL